METRQLGTTGMLVSVLGLGGSEIGYQNIDPAIVQTLINEALDEGLNIIDTAECYANSEELVGNAVCHRRDDYFLFTKCGHDGQSFGLPDWDPALVEKSIERSLKRLKTDRVDLLLIHSCSLEVLKRGDVIKVVQKAKKAGKTNFIGFSGDNEAALFAIQSGVFDVLQTSVNIADQSVLEKVLPAARAKKMGVIAKRPIANAAWTKTAATVGNYAKPYFERLQKLDYDFLKSPPEKVAIEALRFTLGCPGVCTAIVGTTKPGRWTQNAGMLLADGPMPRGLYDAIRARWNHVAQADWLGQT